MCSLRPLSKVLGSEIAWAKKATGDSRHEPYLAVKFIVVGALHALKSRMIGSGEGMIENLDLARRRREWLERDTIGRTVAFSK